MRKILKCRVAIFLLAGWVILSVAGFLGKDSIYKNYSVDTAKTPYFVLVLQGFHDHIYPWNQEYEAFGDERLPEKVYAKDLEEENTAKQIESTEMEEDTKTAVPKQFVSVEEDYFDDAVFIGDSRTVGLHDYGGLDKADFFATVGMNVYDLWTEKFCEVNGKKVTLEEALSAKQYKKIYFQIGINEMGRGTLEGFMEKYAQSVEMMKQLQPEAIVYVQAIMKVTKEKSDSDAIFNNTGIQARNEEIQKLADGERVFFIDVNEVVCDENGGLKESLTFDNLHLYGSKYDIWVDFLKTKGIKEAE